MQVETAEDHRCEIVIQEGYDELYGEHEVFIDTGINYNEWTPEELAEYIESQQKEKEGD